MNYRNKLQKYKSKLKQTKNQLLKKQVEEALMESSKYDAGMELGGVKLFACFVHLKDQYVIHDIDFPKELIEEYPSILEFLQTGRRLTINYEKEKSRKKKILPIKSSVFTITIRRNEDYLKISGTSLDEVLSQLNRMLSEGLLLNEEQKRTRKEG